MPWGTRANTNTCIRLEAVIFFKALTFIKEKPFVGSVQSQFQPTCQNEKPNIPNIHNQSRG